jgi:hypothetical protein
MNCKSFCSFLHPRKINLFVGGFLLGSPLPRVPLAWFQGSRSLLFHTQRVEIVVWKGLLHFHAPRGKSCSVKKSFCIFTHQEVKVAVWKDLFAFSHTKRSIKKVTKVWNGSMKFSTLSTFSWVRSQCYIWTNQPFFSLSMGYLQCQQVTINILWF